MRIAIVSTSSGMSPGYRSFLVNIIPHLRELAAVETVSLFTPPGSLMADDPDLDTQVVGGGLRGMRRAVRQTATDVVLIPAARSFSAPPVPTVTMIWNMEPLVTPISGNTIREAVRNVGRRLSIRRSCRRSSALFVVSEHVRDFLLKTWRVDERKIHVIHLGAEAPLPPDLARRPESVPDKTPFIFTAAGALRPARGISDAVEGLIVLAERGQHPTLVVGGAPTAGTVGYAEGLKERARDAGVDAKIIWAGHLGRAEMGWCMQNCEVFIATTRAEGMSVLLLEVLSYGCLTVATDLEDSRNVLGETALYYPVGDASGLADVVTTALAASAPDRSARRAASQERARTFDWTGVASNVASMFESVIV